MNKNILWGLLLLLCCGVIWVYTQIDDKSVIVNQEKEEQIFSRRTVILDGYGNQLHQIAYQNTTGINGSITITVDTLEPIVSFDNYSGQFQWDTTDSQIELSNDDGASYFPIINWTDTDENFETSGNITVTGYLNYSSNPAYPKIYAQDAEPDISNDTVAYWNDTDGGPAWYLLLDIGGTQKKVQLN